MRLTFVLGLAFLSTALTAQTRLKVDTTRICNYSAKRSPRIVYGFESDDEAQTLVSKIMKYTGLPENFRIQAANVSTASAAMEGTERVILYNQDFIRKEVSVSGTDWAAASIIAHEVGHHLLGHPLSGIHRPDQELAADKYSGSVLFKMGATIEQAKAAVGTLNDEPVDPNYPDKSARMAAVTNGWLSAKEQFDKLRQEKGSDTTTTKAEDEAARYKKEAEEERARNQELEDKIRNEKKSKRAKRDDDDDDDPVIDRPVSRPRIGWFCGDVYGNRVCAMSVSATLGTACGCPGVPGYGVTVP